MRKEGEKRRRKTGETFFQFLSAFTSFFSFLYVQNTCAGRRPGKQQKKEQPRRARSIYDDGHLEDIQRFYAQGSNERAQSATGEKSLEVSREPSASSEEEKKPFVFS